MKINQIIINELSESAQTGVAEGNRYDRRDAYQRDYDSSVSGMDHPRNHGDDERHDLDPTDWYIVKDGKMLVASIYPRQVQQAISQGFSRTRAEAQARADSQGVAEAGNANSGRRGPNFQDNSPAIPGRVEPLPQGLKHHADASRYGGTEPDDEDDRLLGPASRHRLHQAVTPDDWFDESQEKIAGRHDPDDFDNMVGRLKQLAGAGPLKTVWDPARRVYRNVPHAVQPPQQSKKPKQ